MFSEFKSLSFMGVSNYSEMFFSDKDLNSMEFNFLVRPTLDFEDECNINIAPLQDGDDDDIDELHQKKEEVQAQDHQEEEDEEEKEDDNFKFLVSTLEIKLPSLGDFKIEDDDDNDGFKTPTSLDQKIPAVIRQCPPAPKKPKSLPSTKRKSPCQQVLLDLSNEIESLFPPALVADLGGKIKKVRQGNDTK